MSTTIQQIQALLNDLTPQQLARVKQHVNLSNINIMTLSAGEARALLISLKAAVGTVTNPVKSGMDESQAKLDAEKDNRKTIWQDARKAYYAQLNVVNSNDSIENKQKADDLFLEMKLAGEHMVDATKRANNAAIQGILFNA